ncbi:hypothetical protein FGO68_gene3221 [Halteria grandinella]|uniref:Uncharacterized protein n=1 Tax=Halteria grandinella TaxID=5974 RepID=A0A8J8NZK5_HALGN|nr:hypothetical protein FGO68_gene3221 [Halteria grandinella]
MITASEQPRELTFTCFNLTHKQSKPITSSMLLPVHAFSLNTIEFFMPFVISQCFTNNLMVTNIETSQEYLVSGDDLYESFMVIGSSLILAFSPNVTTLFNLDQDGLVKVQTLSQGLNREVYFPQERKTAKVESLTIVSKKQRSLMLLSKHTLVLMRFVNVGGMIKYMPVLLRSSGISQVLDRPKVNVNNIIKVAQRGCYIIVMSDGSVVLLL